MTDKTPPRRFKELAELTPSEHMERKRSGVIPETDQFIKYRAQVLADAGIEDDTQKSVEDMTVEDHLKRIRKGK